MLFIIQTLVLVETCHRCISSQINDVSALEMYNLEKEITALDLSSCNPRSSATDALNKLSWINLKSRRSYNRVSYIYIIP